MIDLSTILDHTAHSHERTPCAVIAGDWYSFANARTPRAARVSGLGKSAMGMIHLDTARASNTAGRRGEAAPWTSPFGALVGSRRSGRSPGGCDRVPRRRKAVLESFCGGPYPQRRVIRCVHQAGRRQASIEVGTLGFRGSSYQIRPDAAAPPQSIGVRERNTQPFCWYRR